MSILVGGGLGIVLSVFHFFVEHKLAKKLGFDEHKDENALAEFHLKLKIVPRIGMIVIMVIFLLMINAARGIFLSNLNSVLANFPSAIHLTDNYFRQSVLLISKIVLPL